MKESIAIGYEHDSLFDRARDLANQFNWTIDNQALPRLCVTEDKLVLLMEHFAPLFVDFNHTVIQHRRDAGKKQGLVKACKPSLGIRILDATAGWGRDAAILASFGADVVMLERQPLMSVLLADGIRRLEPSSGMKLSLLAMDAKHYLENLAEKDYPDVIYIDPMHPLRQKSALVKKDMQALQKLIGADEDALDLIHLSIKRAKKRVVVKWPQRLPCLLTPSLSVPGKTVRFDIYTAC